MIPVARMSIQNISRQPELLKRSGQYFYRKNDEYVLHFERYEYQNEMIHAGFLICGQKTVYLSTRHL